MTQTAAADDNDSACLPLTKAVGMTTTRILFTILKHLISKKASPAKKHQTGLSRNRWLLNEPVKADFLSGSLYFGFKCIIS